MVDKNIRHVSVTERTLATALGDDRSETEEDGVTTFFNASISTYRRELATPSTSGTTMNHDDATADPAGVWAAGPRDVILISEGGNFDGTGTIELLSHYLDLTAPTG